MTDTQITLTKGQKRALARLKEIGGVFVVTLERFTRKSGEQRIRTVRSHKGVIGQAVVTLVKVGLVTETRTRNEAGEVVITQTVVS